jgi:hypothetical protein
MLIEAFGTGTAYNLYTFAQEFKPESINLIFAGPGTFWTDLAGVQDVAGMKLLQSGAAAPAPPTKPNATPQAPAQFAPPSASPKQP